jgi:hypothetical protein
MPIRGRPLGSKPAGIGADACRSSHATSMPLYATCVRVPGAQPPIARSASDSESADGAITWRARARRCFRYGPGST